MALAAETRSVDSLRLEVSFSVYRNSAPVSAVLQSKELAVAVNLKAVAVSVAPDFLQTQKVRRISFEKFFNFLETLGQSVYIPTLST